MTVTLDYIEAKNKANKLIFIHSLYNHGLNRQFGDSLKTMDVNASASELKNRISARLVLELESLIPGIKVQESTELDERIIVFDITSIKDKFEDGAEVLAAENRHDMRMIEELKNESNAFSIMYDSHSILYRNISIISDFKDFGTSGLHLIKTESGLYLVVPVHSLYHELFEGHHRPISSMNDLDLFNRTFTRLCHYLNHYEEGMQAILDYKEEMNAKLAEELALRKEEYIRNVQRMIYEHQDGVGWTAKELSYNNLSYEGLDVHVMSQNGFQHEGCKILPAFREIVEVDGYTFEGWGKITGFDSEHARSLDGKMPVVVQDYIYAELDIEDWMPFLPDAPNGQSYEEIVNSADSDTPSVSTQLEIHNFIDIPEPADNEDFEPSELETMHVYYNHTGVAFERFIVVEGEETYYYATVQDVWAHHEEAFNHTIELIEEDVQGEKNYTHHVYVGDNKMMYPTRSEVMAFDYKNPTEVINFPLLRR